MESLVISFLVLMCVVSFLNLFALVLLYRKQLNFYFASVFASVLVANVGYLAGALAESAETVIIATKACYLGSVFLPMFEFFIIVRICRFRFPDWAKLLLGLLSTSVLLLSCTIGHSDIYYKSVTYMHMYGVGYCACEYGPWHFMWNLVLVGYTLANIVVIAYAARTRINVSYKNLIAVALMTLISIISFLISREVGSDTMVVPVVYVIDEFILFFVCLRVRMNDISDSLLESLEEENRNAYVAFSDKGIYLGCNDIAYKFFPELKEFRVDRAMPEDLEISKHFKSLMDSFVRKDSPSDSYFAYGRRNYRVCVRKVPRNKISHIVLFRIEDETTLQRYIKKLDTHNTKLKDVIKDNDRHIHAIQEQMIVGMAKMVESRDSNTGGHIMRTSGIVAIFAEELQKDKGFGRTREYYDALIAAAPMHDLGKIAIDDKILRKPGSFTPEEFEVMKTHAEKGAAIVENLLSEIESPFFVEIAKNVACFHHERFDGSGYPYGLFGANIPFEARVMAVADVYDALVSKRCYKEQMSFEEAYNLIMNSMGTHFDPRLKPCFVACREKLEHYYLTSPGWESIEKDKNC
ncbi:MAG: HD domain-containing protein [Fibrobacter sp.]|nr:HD domain-containing protein [Fibrobacter sp.]